MRKERPHRVERARRQDDLESLRAFGAAGNRVVQEKRRERSANVEEEDRYRKEQALKAAIEEWKKTQGAANEHIVPVDPEEEKEDA